MAARFPLFHETFNRNKKSVTLDLRDPLSRPIMKKLVEWCDVLAENFKHGTLARWVLFKHGGAAALISSVLTRTLGAARYTAATPRTTLCAAHAAHAARCTPRPAGATATTTSSSGTQG